jgi:hypothetical protein
MPRLCKTPRRCPLNVSHVSTFPAAVVGDDGSVVDAMATGKSILLVVRADEYPQARMQRFHSCD